VKFWILVLIVVCLYLLFRNQRKTSSPTTATAVHSDLATVLPVGDETPITRDEWAHFKNVVDAAIAGATTSLGLIREVPRIYRRRFEHGTYVPCIQKWNDDRLRYDERRQGVSAELWTQPTLYVYTGEWKQIDNMMQHVHIDRTNTPGPWNAELRGLVAVIEANLAG
jgi:hypothetical protein